ncbi:uncharacterized protein TRAVEDRAFT_86439, partial [Trametes versicolor FP-101664 SS1]|uniref:uncharacterized protein n=1 Tax=Trametes versicolor (strain FP-101664) TaxID=717944 RepID=UPI000462411D
PEVNVGLALGAHTYSVLNADGELLHGATRLARLVLPDTAYLIWVLRCERVIGEREPLPGNLEHTYVENRWMKMISHRLHLDRSLASKRTAGNRAIPATAVCATWEKTLRDEHRLPADWTREKEVLVG